MVDTVVIVSDSGYINGGNAKVALKSAVGLSKRGIKVILFCGTFPIDTDVLKNNIEIVCLNQKDILNDKYRIRAIFQGIWNFKAKLEFENLLKKLNPKATVVHFHSWSKVLSCSIFSVTKKYGFKIVITAHDYFGFCPNGGFFNYKKKEICHYKPISLNCIFCNCDHRKFVHKIWRVTRQIVQNLVLWRNKDITFITISNLNDRVVKENLDKRFMTMHLINPVELSNNTSVNVQKNNYYLFIGRLSEEKGIELFCQALKELKLPGIVLGDGYKLGELKTRYPNIKFMGWVSTKEMEEYLYQTRALIFPSLWYEGAPLIITEMKSFGIPCIVSDATSAIEEIEDGITGYVFKSGDIDDLKSAILLTKQTDLNNIQKNISKIDLNIYKMINHVNNLIELYNKILI